MGIFKFRHQGPANDPDVQLCPLVTLDELVQEQRFPTAKNHINEAEELEILDGDGEHALLDDQICSFPYELYELENLKEILSVEAWNLYLTEEERFHLTAFLPDMDHETFEFTMLELLKGGNLYFGSPLEMFFHRLKGGFYSLRVARYREGLKLLQEKRFCHSLMSYHESMVKKFVEMRKAWSNCQPSASVEERVRIWNNTNNRKPVLLVDLNAFPTDEEISSKSDKKVMALLPQKKLKLMNEEASLHVLAMDWGAMVLNKTKAKGVLKVKPCEASSMPKQVVQSLPAEPREPLRRPPKGVLKIKPKATFTSVVESPMTFPVHHDQCSASGFGVHPSKLSPSHFSSQWQDKSLNRNINNLHQLDRDRNAYKVPLTSEHTNYQQASDHHLGISGPFDDARSSLRMVKAVKDSWISSDDGSDFKECFDGQQTRALSTSSAGIYQSGLDNFQRQTMPFHQSFSKEPSRTSAIVADSCYQGMQPFPDHSEHGYTKEKGQGNDRSHMFPITYKRKKSYTKLGAARNLKQPSPVRSMEPAAPIAAVLHQVEKAKPRKIRVKGCKEFNS